MRHWSLLVLFLLLLLAIAASSAAVFSAKEPAATLNKWCIHCPTIEACALIYTAPHWKQGTGATIQLLGVKDPPANHVGVVSC